MSAAQPHPVRACTLAALVLSGPAIVLAVQGDLDVAGAAVRLLLALLVSAVVAAGLRSLLPVPAEGAPASEPEGAAGLRRREEDTTSSAAAA